MTNEPIEVETPLTEYQPGDRIIIPEDYPIERTILPNGIRVISQFLPHTESASIGVWVPRGSRYETNQAAGASHFLEHLLFKGTTTRSAFQIAQTFDRLGGESNATTSHENTRYYARVLGEDLQQALECLMDMVTSPLLSEDDFASEQSIILDELAMSKDDPGELIHETFTAKLFGEDALGHPIGGTKETVENMEIQTIIDHYIDGYQPQSLTLAAAGKVQHEELCQMVHHCLQYQTWLAKSPWPQWNDFEVTPPPKTLNSASFTPPTPAICGRGKTVIDLPLEQAHVLVGGLGVGVKDLSRPTDLVMEALLGGGMSSRLFQSIRDERGLAYSTYAFSFACSDIGQFGMYATCAPRNVAEVASLMRGELEKLAQTPPQQTELDHVKGHLRGGVKLAMEDTLARMARLGYNQTILGKHVPVSLHLQRIMDVTPQQIQRHAQRLAETAQVEVWLGDV